MKDLSPQEFIELAASNKISLIDGLAADYLDVVRLAETHKHCLDCGDRAGLLELAREYGAFGMPRTARVVRLEAAAKARADLD